MKVRRVPREGSLRGWVKQQDAVVLSAAQRIASREAGELEGEPEQVVVAAFQSSI